MRERDADFLALADLQPGCINVNCARAERKLRHIGRRAAGGASEKSSFSRKSEFKVQDAGFQQVFGHRADPGAKWSC